MAELPEDVLDEGQQGALAVGEVEIDSRPLRFERVEGRCAYDLLGASVVMNLISDRVRRSLEDGGFTGWEAIPVTIALQEGVERDDYSLLVVRGRAGPIRDELSERIEMPAPVPGGQAGPGLRGLLFDPQTWDGSDVFAPEGTRLVFITDRVKAALESLRPTNTLIEPISSIERITW